MNEANPFTNAKVVGANFNPADYAKPSAKRGDPALVMSRSQLMEFYHCPSRWIAGYEKKASSALDYGSMIDCAILTPSEFEKNYVVAPATYPAGPKHAKVNSGEIKEGDPLKWNKNAAVCKAWHDEREDKQVILADEMDDVALAVKRFNDDPELNQLLLESAKQVYCVATFCHDGLTIPVKALLDLVPDTGSPFERSLIDFKTGASAHPAKWSKDVFNYNYHVQAAFFFDIYTAACPEKDIVELRHIVQENYHPFEIGKRILSFEYLELGRLQYTRALRLYCQCLKTNTWPKYDSAGQFNGWSMTEPEPYMVT